MLKFSIALKNDFELFRYFHEPYDLELLQEGRLRVGTLNAYKDLMIQDQARGDNNEGKIEVFNVSNTIADVRNIDSQLKKFLDPDGEALKAGRNITFKNYTKVYETPNCLTLCLTKQGNNERHLEEFGPKCVRIKNIDEFIHTVTKAIVTTLKDTVVTQCCAFPIVYKNKRFFYPENWGETNPVWIKDENYMWQDEFRLLWPVADPFKLTDFLDIEDQNLCSLVEAV